jgi:hypothetical protein
MQNKTKKAAPTKQKTTTTTAEPCIFTAADKKRLKTLLSKDSFDELMQVVAGDQMPYLLIDSAGEEIDLMSPFSIKYWHDDGFQTIYQIGQRVYAYDYDGKILIHVASDVTDVIREYPPAEGYYEEKCAYFGVNPPLSPAKRGYVGLCRVWIYTFYYDNCVPPGDHSAWARADYRTIIWFESYSAARKWINQDEKEHHGYADIQYPKGFYLKAHNEYAPRKYKICL